MIRKPMPNLDKHIIPEMSEDAFRWLDLLRNYTYDLKEYVATVDLPLLSANTTILQAIPVAGVNIGDKILHIEHPTVSDEFMVLHGYVSAANTIQVQIHRGKAGSYNPAQEDWTFLILKNTR